jgi:4-amino-4-deoxy-L-arabinose transferase-like glycosyltransferase
MFGGGGQSNANNDKLIRFLNANHQDEKYLLAAQNSMAVSPLIIHYGAPVLALGGFGGGDPTCSVEQFAQMVKAHQFRYFLLGGGRGSFFGPPGQPNQRPNRVPQANNADGAPGGWGGFGNQGGFQADISKWVRENGKPVDPKLWRIVDTREGTANAPAPSNNNFNGFGGFGGRRGGGQQLYDLRPNG